MMTESQKIAKVQLLCSSDSTCTSEVAKGYLDIAKDRILVTMYPFGVPDCVYLVPDKYEMLQCELASRYFARRGGLGETSHSENGIVRAWESSNDMDIMGRIVPIMKVM